MLSKMRGNRCSCLVRSGTKRRHLMIMGARDSLRNAGAKAIRIALREIAHRASAPLATFGAEPKRISNGGPLVPGLDHQTHGPSQAINRWHPGRC